MSSGGRPFNGIVRRHVDTPRKVSRSALGICAAAALLHAYQAKGNGGIEIAFPLFMWSIVPYMVPLVLAITGVRHAIAIIAAACAFAFDIYIFVAVHTSQSSTARSSRDATSCGYLSSSASRFSGATPRRLES